MIKLITLLTLAGFLFIKTACGNGDQDYGQQDDLDVEQEMAEVQQADGFDTPDDFRSDLEGALHYYLGLVDALVEENTDDARDYAGQFNQAVVDIHSADLDQSAAAFWDEYSERIKSHLSALQKHDDVDDQRYEFEHISEALIEVVKSMGPLDMALYQQRCPMVRDGEGDWLSSHEEIRNPYHGEEMMNCGSTVEEL